MIKEINEKLYGENKITDEEKSELLEKLFDLMEGPQNAEDLHLVGGFVPLISMMLNHKNEILRLKAGKVFASAVQNNIKVQKWALENNALLLVPQYHKEISIQLKEQVLSSLSAFARASIPAVRLEFLKASGLELVFGILTNPKFESKLDAKGLSILNDYLLNEIQMFPSSIHVVSQQIEKQSIIPIILSKMLQAKITDFFYQDKVYTLIEYIFQHYKKELIENEKGKLKEFIVKLSEEEKNNEQFKDALKEQIDKFSQFI